MNATKISPCHLWVEESLEEILLLLLVLVGQVCLAHPWMWNYSS